MYLSLSLSFSHSYSHSHSLSHTHARIHALSLSLSFSLSTSRCRVLLVFIRAQLEKYCLPLLEEKYMYTYALFLFRRVPSTSVTWLLYLCRYMLARRYICFSLLVWVRVVGWPCDCLRLCVTANTNSRLLRTKARENASIRGNTQGGKGRRRKKNLKSRRYEKR